MITKKLRWKFTRGPSAQSFIVYAPNREEAWRKSGCDPMCMCTPAGYLDVVRSVIVDDPDDPSSWTDPKTDPSLRVRIAATRPARKPTGVQKPVTATDGGTEVRSTAANAGKPYLETAHPDTRHVNGINGVTNGAGR